MSVTTIEFTGRGDVDDHVADVVAAIATAQTTIEATTIAILTSTCDPDDATVQGFRDTLLAEMQSDDIRAPLVVAVGQLVAALNVILEGYGATVIVAPA